MNILLVSQCSKKAKPETARIIDQFAERKGSGVWQTTITEQGLTTLKKLLKKTARRNTAVACHRYAGRTQTELMWVVGNPRKFNMDGSVPTNYTERDIVSDYSESQWRTTEAIAVLSAIAALFHDFGKANVLFQKKLTGKSGKNFEPYRHEWVSLRMFQCFVGELSDKAWLEKLSMVTAEHEEGLLDEQGFLVLRDSLNHSPTNPFKELPNIAKTVAWLILTHHRLPESKKDIENSNPAHIPFWLTGRLTPEWNSPQLTRQDWGNAQGKKSLEQVWSFPKRTPLTSNTWCKKAQRIGQRALNQFTSLDQNWLNEGLFTLHLSRLALMLADHHFSSLSGNQSFRDRKFKVNANTDRETKKPKQQLDEHLIGVYRCALQLVRVLPVLKQGLPTITQVSGLKKRSTNARFRWQDKAFDHLKTINRKSERQGFFGINMASTGKGKTLANARIMYALSNEKLGCRFNVALGLRTLTLQTGDALRERLNLSEDDLAVLIGSQAVTELHRHQQNEQKENQKKEQQEENRFERSGSASSEPILDQDAYIRYDGALSDTPLNHWLEAGKEKLNQLVSAPVVVSTIDHLMPATEGSRGGKQIAPMLRLLTSDLVLDESDDFGLEDMPALCRLVNWAGMLGSRVLLSSATLPPALLQNLFDAYRAGRAEYQKACGDPSTQVHIPCAWIDEFTTESSDHESKASFTQAHQTFVEKRIQELQKQSVVQSAKLLDIENPEGFSQPSQSQAIELISHTLQKAIPEIHQAHSETAPTGNKVSFGLIRMANINNMVALSQQLVAAQFPEQYELHFCIYHSQFPLVSRAEIEKTLDSVLKRHNPEAIWQTPAVQRALHAAPNKQHIFIVMATPVAEVGRDHDYDWAIAEPSSMRSLIQLAGRIQRHRRKQPKTPNLWILDANINAMFQSSTKPAYTRPGFEDKQLQLATDHKRLSKALHENQFQTINAIPRIQEAEPLNPTQNLVDLEHAQSHRWLDGGAHLDLDIDLPDFTKYAAYWWQQPASLTAQFNLLTPFRQSIPSADYFLLPDQWGEQHFFELIKGEKYQADHLIDPAQVIPTSSNVSFWGNSQYLQALEQLPGWEVSDEHVVEQLTRRLGVVSLRQLSAEKTWRYDDIWGFYQAQDA